MLIFSRIIIKFICAKRIVLLFILIFSFSTIFFNKESIYNYFSNKKSANYFLLEDQYKELGYIIDSQNCKIPNIDPWHSELKDLMQFSDEKFNCTDKINHWTYKKGYDQININESAIVESGYAPSQVVCCYRSIKRNEELKSRNGEYSQLVDSRVVYSQECKVMSLETKPLDEFILVTCKPRYLFWYFGDLLTSNILYQNFHALIPSTKLEMLKNKQKYWEDNEGNKKLPINVLILGIDSTSRLHFHRSLPKTVEILKSFNAIEMLGYTKVGENTFPNLVTMLTGYSPSELQKICWFSQYTKLDDCPLIWKLFSNANYITAEVQDSPPLNNWNYDKTGFVETPTDFYIRPFMLAIHQKAGKYPTRVRCIGYKNVEETILEYIADIFEFGQRERIPIFLMSWLTQAAHGSFNDLQLKDAEFSKFLTHLMNKGLLKNTLLFVVSDHGYRYGPLRQTLPGYYEDKLPALWIKVPDSITIQNETKSSLEPILKTNSQRLSSTYDLYHTLLHVLQNEAEDSVDSYGTKIKRKFGNSLLKPLPVDRNCDEAGIPSSFCACTIPIKLPPDDGSIKTASIYSIQYLNNILPKECTKLKLKEAKGGAQLGGSLISVNRDEKTIERTLVLQFLTEPGDFLLEATVDEHSKNNFTISKNIQRLNGFTRKVNCINDPVLALYCYCK